jgi:catechol 2,3-dioxygenase-like lactoylglutathione lyase family enzyme
MNRPGRIMGLPFVVLVVGIFFGKVALSQQPSSDNPQAPPVSGLVPDHATLSVANIEVEAEWYGRVLGFKPFSKSGDADLINWHLVIPGYRIDLIQAKGSKRPAPVGPVYHEVNGQMVPIDPIDLQQGWVHVVFHVDDVAAALKQLQALKVDVAVTRLKDGTPIQLNMKDPEGNAVEIRRNLVV